MRKIAAILCATAVLTACGGGDSSTPATEAANLWPLKVSDNGRYLVHAVDKSPFFWQGDTAWFIFAKLKREEIIKYLDDRKAKGYNVIQVSIQHTLPIANAYGAYSMEKGTTDVSKPLTTPGSDPADPKQYDYWDHADYVIDQAAARGMYVAIVPIWGTNVANNLVSADQTIAYSKFLADRYKNKPNIMWFVGGDQKGTVHPEVWNAMGQTLRANDPNHLITYHPRGRWLSSEWFHNEKWMDFNMFQSGHRTYSQDTPANNPGERNYGEDNYKYVDEDYARTPVKPTIDSEPSYEEIPKGLGKNTDGTRWGPEDVRRYAYWSVFAGAFGHTYGHNSLMQMYTPGDNATGAAFPPVYNPRDYWDVALSAPGASQMQYLKNLMLSRPFLVRVPDNSMVNDQSTLYDYVAATRGTNYAFFYTYTGRNFKVNLGKISGTQVKASWFDPKSGAVQSIGTLANTGITTFDPPGVPTNGNDWVLILDSL